MWTKLTVTIGKLLAGPSSDTSQSIIDGGGGSTTTSSGKVTSLMGAANKLKTIVTKILGPILTIIGVAAVLYAVYLGVMYAKAESADKRKDIQGRLIGACIGAVIIIAGATLCFALDWTKIYHDVSVGSAHTWVDSNADGWCDNCDK